MSIRTYPNCPWAVGTAQQVTPNTEKGFQRQFDPDLAPVLTSVHIKQSNVHSSERSSLCSNVSGLHARWEQMSMPVGDIRADQVRRLVFLVGHPTAQALQKSHRFLLRKDALKAEACVFLWNETCSCCKIFWHKEKQNKTKNRRHLKRKEATPLLKHFTVIQLILPFQHPFFFPPAFFFLTYFTLYYLLCTGSGNLHG